MYGNHLPRGDPVKHARAYIIIHTTKPDALIPPPVNNHTIALFLPIHLLMLQHSEANQCVYGFLDFLLCLVIFFREIQSNKNI